MGLSDKAIRAMKASVPLLESSGVEITGRMYGRMMPENPALKGMFNMSHLRHVTDNNVGPENSLQAISLAQAVLTYAENCDNVPALGSAIEAMAEKHVAFSVTPEQYEIVGKNLLWSIKQQLCDKASDELIEGWQEGYQFLAEALIKREAELYDEKTNAKGGWGGYRKFTVVEKEVESDSITSFYLKPTDGGAITGFKPGQYITVKIPKGASSCPFASEHDLTRNYSLSCGPGKDHLRISVRKDGIVSTYLHDAIMAGDELEISVPCGVFHLCPHSEVAKSGRPIVFLAAGVGLTPLMSMMQGLLDSGSVDGGRISFIQCVKGAQEQPMKTEFEMAKDKGVKYYAFYSKSSSSSSSVTTGRLTLDSLRSVVNPDKDSDFYFCGPRTFMENVRRMLVDLGVDQKRLHCEFFGPTPVY